MNPLSTPAFAPPARLTSVPWESLTTAREAVLDGLDRVLSGEAAEKVLSRTLRKGDFPSETRTAVAEALFGVGLWRRTLRAFVGDDAGPDALLFALIHRLGGRDREVAATIVGRAVPVLREPTTFGDRWSFPDWLSSHLAAQTDELEPLATSLAIPGPIFLRTNTLAITREALQRELEGEGVLTAPTRLSSVGLEVLGPRPNIFGLASHQQGLFEVQDAGSQLLGTLVGAKPGERVLDLCAGAGGKSLQLAAQLENRGALHVYDVDRSRLERLRTRASRADAHVRILDRIPDEACFDRVLIDAPCSELGTLRRGPDLRWRLSPEVLTRHVAVQRELLATAARVLVPRGTLVYATCTWNPLENESLVDAFLSTHPDFACVQPANVDSSVLDAAGHLRTWPHRHRTDGFFAAVLQRR